MKTERQQSEHKKKPLRILFVHHGKGLGGAPLSLLYLIKALRKNNHHIRVIFLHPSPALDLYKAENIEVIGPIHLMDFPHTAIWWLRWYHGFTLIKSIIDTIKVAFWKAPQILAQEHADIIHLNTSSLVAWAYAAHRIQLPIVWHIREPLAQGYFGIRKAIITKIINRYASAIVPISLNDASPWQGNPKVTIVHNPVDEQKFYPSISYASFLADFKLSPNIPKILFLGGLSYEKGTHVIIEAFKRVLHHVPAAQLLIAGACDLSSTKSLITQTLSPHKKFQSSVSKSISDLGVSIKLLGSIHTIPQAMAASDIVVFPATIGHFARPIIEAGFMKKPVIASAMAPLDELVINLKTGFLIDPTNPTLWAEKITLLLCDKSLNHLMGSEHYKFCKQQFNIEKHVSSIENIYTHLPKGVHQ